MKRPDLVSIAGTAAAIIAAVAFVWLADKVGKAMAEAAQRFDQTYQEHQRHEH